MMYYRIILRNGIILLALFTAVFSLNFIVDPFNFNQFFNLKLSKDSISYQQNYRLYKMIEYKNSPESFIILGDSRSNSLLAKYFNDYSVYNFSYGGGTLYEIIDTFWYASNITKLKKVIIAIPFSVFNSYESMNLTSEANSIIENPYKYYQSFFTTKVSLLNIYSKIFKVKINNEKSKIDKEKHEINKKSFWSIQLNNSTRFFQKYKYPSDQFIELQKITEYCHINDIEIQFLIPPGHVDLQEKVTEFNRNKEYLQYKIDLSTLAEVLDFDFPNELTKNKQNFSDPFHFNQTISKKIVSVLLEKKPKETHSSIHKRLNRVGK